MQKNDFQELRKSNREEFLKHIESKMELKSGELQDKMSDLNAILRHFKRENPRKPRGLKEMESIYLTTICFFSHYIGMATIGHRL